MTGSLREVLCRELRSQWFRPEASLESPHLAPFQQQHPTEFPLVAVTQVCPIVEVEREVLKPQWSLPMRHHREFPGHPQMDHQ